MCRLSVRSMCCQLHYTLDFTLLYLGVPISWLYCRACNRFRQKYLNDLLDGINEVDMRKLLPMEMGDGTIHWIRQEA
jgi:hypothetical protein